MSVRTLVPQSISIWSLGAGLMLTSAAALHAVDGAVVETRNILSRWVETRQTIARIKADWEQDRETLKSTIALFESQQERLDASLKKLGGDNQQVVKETSENEALLKRYVGALDGLKGLVAVYEKRIKALAPNFPPPLAAREQVSKILSLVPEDPEKTEVSVISRVQNLILILKAVQEFNGDIHLENEIRADGGKELQVRTLYLGLGLAWFVNADGSFAGTGGPSEDGWVWKTDVGIAGQVQQAIAVYEKSAPAVYVALPAEVKSAK